MSSSIIVKAQISYNLKINKISDELERSKTEKMIYSLTLESNIPDSSIFKEYAVSVKPNLMTSTLPQSEFEIDFKDCEMYKLTSGYTFYLTLLPNVNLDIERKIDLEVIISSLTDLKLEKIQNLADKTNQTVTIEPIEADSVLDAYNYLAYVGTNFDLVDGVKASNLFFATNIYQLPKYGTDGFFKDFGFNLTIYGNRAITITEDFGLKDYEYKYVRIPNTDSSRVFRNQGNLSRTIVSDNLGLLFSPIIKWPHRSEADRTVRFHLTPQVEFAFRRFTETEIYSNVTPSDSSKVIRYRGSDLIIRNRETNVKYNNSYDLNLAPLSFMAIHETKNISVRLHLITGYSFSFSKERISDTPQSESFNPIKSRGAIYYATRIWITEAVTGITLGGEMSNRLIKDNYQPFFNVTLSKALSFKNIGSIFDPIATR